MSLHLHMHISFQCFFGAPVLHIPPGTLLLEFLSLVQPGKRKEVSHMKLMKKKRTYFKQPYKVVEGVLKPEKFGAARYQLMLQLNTHCTLASHPELLALGN